MATMEEYTAFLAQVRKLTGLDMITPDEGGLVMLRVEDRYNLNLQFVEATGKVFCFVEVAELPKDAPKAVYRDLLVGGLFGKETAGLPKDFIADHADTAVRIPMGKEVNLRSLNLSNSAAIILYEALRQQGFPGLY